MMEIPTPIWATTNVMNKIEEQESAIFNFGKYVIKMRYEIRKMLKPQTILQNLLQIINVNNELR